MTLELSVPSPSKRANSSKWLSDRVRITDTFLKDLQGILKRIAVKLILKTSNRRDFVHYPLIINSWILFPELNLQFPSSFPSFPPLIRFPINNSDLLPHPIYVQKIRHKRRHQIITVESNDYYRPGKCSTIASQPANVQVQKRTRTRRRKFSPETRSDYLGLITLQPRDRGRLFRPFGGGGSFKLQGWIPSCNLPTIFCKNNYPTCDPLPTVSIHLPLEHYQPL